jgi:hypothetical protein
MSSSSFYSDSGITTADADAVESSKNAAAQSAQDAAGHASTASDKADEANDSAIAAAASASTANNSNVQTVASNLGGTNTIGTVAGNIADINTVAGMESDVDTVANPSYKAKVETVADSSYKSDVETVAASSYKSDVETVADATYKAKVETVANSTYKTKVEEVAADLSGSNTIGAAVQSASDAATSASNASTSETNAASSESTAATHASNASTHATTASGHADDAEDAKTAAQAARDAAQGHRTQTGQDAAAAAASANSASSSASDAASSEANAAADALVASNSADSAKIDAYVVKNISSTYGTLNAAINSASSSASQAASSASTASTHATTASGHASTAATHAANLGSVAYQDLTAIALSKSGTAVDVFVYDTSKDSDGGAWRNRTQGTSWYNEALNTSERGATKKFPAVAVIVAADDGDELIIYDGDDPSMPMWFKHGIGNGVRFATDGYGFDISTLTAKDGKIFVGLQQEASHELGVYGGLLVLDYVADTTEKYAGRGSGSNRGVRDGVRFTAWGGHMNIVENNNRLADGEVNDVAVKILPNAPIDPNNGLPVPTIAVATRLGVSVIKDDGGIVDITGQAQPIGQVAFTKDNKIACHHNYASELAVYDITEADQSFNDELAVYYPSTNPTAPDYPRVFTGSFNDLRQAKEDFVIASGAGLCNVSGLGNDKDNVMVNYINRDYNTGWLNGDIKLATLMDTTAETISAPELVTNGDFSSFGSNIVSNGDFSNGITDWEEYNTSIALTNVNGRLRVQEDGGTYTARGLQQLTTEVGKTYRVTYDVYPDTASGSTAKVWISTNASTSNSIANDSQQSTAVTGRTFYFTATTTSHRILLTVNPNNQNGAFADYDNVKVEEVVGWEVASTSNSTVNFSNGALTGVRNSEDIVQQTLSTPLTIGETYNISFDITYMSSNHWVYFNTNSQMITPNGSSNPTPVGSYSHTFTATSADTTLFLRAGGTAGLTFTIDNISLRRAVPDRSVNKNGLNIVGNVTKSAVATGAELMGYGTTGASNYLTQPYNADYNFGYGDFCIMGWAKHIGGDQSLFYRGTGNGFHETGGLYLWINNHKLKFRSGGNRQFEIDAPISPMDSGQWHHYVVCRRDGVVYAYQDGVLFHSQNISVSNIDSSTHITKISSGYYANNNVSNRLALLRISATAPTPEQIAKIYRDEKPLFQEGAMCTLYGNSSHVTGMDYDDDTNTIHAGTSSQYGSGGLSEFTGLQRTGLNSNTTSVGYAVSAQNGLVVSE